MSKAFNVRVIHYPLGDQVRVYGAIQNCDDYERDIFDKCRLDEIPPGKYEIEPFSGEAVCVVEDFERLAEESARSSRNRTINRLYYLARSNYWDWFVTLTFDGERVNRYDFDSCVKKLSKWLNNCKQKCPDMCYLVVPEQHKDGAWHFHGLFYNCDDLGFTDSGKRDKDGKPIYNIGSYKFGWTTATRVTDLEKVSKYICKYVTKDMCAQSKGRKRYWASRNLCEAEIDEFLVSKEERREFLEEIADSMTFIKRVDCFESHVDYIEIKGAVEYESK